MGAIIDLNLVRAFDALLQEESVTGAAMRVRVTTPAMSRALSRLRIVVKDPILVRAGRGMVLTAYAQALRQRARVVCSEAEALLTPAANAPLDAIERSFVIRCNDAVAAFFASPLQARIKREAPGLRLIFVPEGDEDAAALRDGSVDLDIGASGTMSEPELLTRTLGHDHFVAVVRRGHELITAEGGGGGGGGSGDRKRITPKHFASVPHLAVSRTGRTARGPIDAALARLGLRREIAAVVPTFLAGLFAVASSDLVCAIPSSLAMPSTATLPIETIAIPLELPRVTIVLMWHPRLDADPAHRWLRDQIVLLTSMGLGSVKPANQTREKKKKKKKNITPSRR